jgi:hypothetical protein
VLPHRQPITKKVLTVTYEDFPRTAQHRNEQHVPAPNPDLSSPPPPPGPPPRFTGVPRLKARRRSRLWPVYAVIAILSWIAFLANIGQFGFGGFIACVAISAYAIYVYRGGRWIIF